MKVVNQGKCGVLGAVRDRTIGAIGQFYLPGVTFLKGQGSKTTKLPLTRAISSAAGHTAHRYVMHKHTHPNAPVPCLQVI